MQFTTVFTIAMSALMVSAAPNYTTEPKSSPSPTATPPTECGQNQKQSCCNSSSGVSVLGLECALDILGEICSGSVQCCNVDSKGDLIGLDLCVPISL